jgi:hypothetical protein
LAELPGVATDGLELVGITGLHAKVADGDPVVTGQSVLRLVAVPTEGRHYLAARSTGLDENRVYRITAWVKAAAGLKVEMELADRPDGMPTNYGKAVFDPARQRVAGSSPGLNRGIEQGPGDWQKIWIDLATADGRIVLAFGIVSRDRTTFKGDGRAGLTFGGIEVDLHNEANGAQVPPRIASDDRY